MTTFKTTTSTKQIPWGKSRARLAGWKTMLVVSVMISADPATAEVTPTPEELNELTVQGVYDRAITLKDGLYEGEPFVPGGASRPRGD